MTTLMIKDLETSVELDRSAMASVAGGWMKDYLPKYGYSFSPVFKTRSTDVEFNAIQDIEQNTLIETVNASGSAWAEGKVRVHSDPFAQNNINFGL
jgi:hypothetical protein